ncbi:unnamed protein product [Fraxinus pennsylvanica]|uniref:DUF668 domain-containing protein n=1 Tax=Fraxinus pennsylvanica TaxID=56036 RepID=A0AAD2DQW2_9LAMI|nr:unnamed protein product [Fraxinus pennsylvanica]
MDGIGELGVYQICGTGSQTVKENWFGNIWSSRKGRTLDPQKPVIGILAFEVSRLMLKVVNIWQCLCDQQIVKLREEIVNSIGIQKLVSRDKDYLMDLVLAEIFENLVSVAKSVDSLGKKCEDPLYHNLERVFDDPDEIDPKWIWWQYRRKKMERKVKKMKKFIASTEQLYQELEELAKLEQSPRQMRADVDMGSQENLHCVQRQVVLQRLEVKNLQETSPWIGKIEDHSSDSLIRGNSVSARIQLSVYTSENKLHSSFSDLAPSDDKIRSRNKQLLVLSPSSIHSEKSTQIKGRRLAPYGFKGQATGGNNSLVKRSYTPSSSGTLGSNDTFNKDTDDNISVQTQYCGTTSTKQSFFNSKRKLLNAPPSTLGNAALAFHYANVILIIKKLASVPELISDDSRDDLYNMLPTSIRNHLSAKLKVFSKSSGSMTILRRKALLMKLALARTLEWLSPLALDTIRWHSFQNFERNRVIFGSNTLLVQTLHFAKQVKTEAAIFELLMGLNYLSRFRRGIKEKTSLQSSCNRACDGYILSKSNIFHNMIDDTSF